MEGGVTLQVRLAVAELKNALRLFSQLAGVRGQHVHGFDEKKLDLHVDYCKHLLDAAKVHLEAAEREEQQVRQKQEVSRQLAMAEDARRKAEEERKIQVSFCRYYWYHEAWLYYGSFSDAIDDCDAEQMERRQRDEEHRIVLEQEERLQQTMVCEIFPTQVVHSRLCSVGDP